MIFFDIDLKAVLRRPQEDNKLLSVYFIEQILFYYSSLAFDFKSKEKVNAFFIKIIQLYQENIALNDYIDFSFVNEYYMQLSLDIINKIYIDDIHEKYGCKHPNYDMLEFLSKSEPNFLEYLNMYKTLYCESILHNALAHLE